ncbi:hypothetical protein Tsubulata_008198 [Turnera subulata]|uniref:NPH3 domain-containing protein n=1 Tax=Turnera subulata TaxID=218843 RepID=A0A9Q0FB05_9ROSI|nr:hypothetical protein Tsubulata_008198 [Turnera subulata]
MAASKSVSWLSKSPSPKEVQLHVPDPPFVSDRELLAAKSAKIASLLKQNPRDNLSSFFQDVPADPETLELVARFCHGFELNFSTENIIPLICLSHYLGMTESQSENNLLRKACIFFHQRVLPSWNETIKALRSAIPILQQAVGMGLVDACLDSLIEKAQVEPHLLGEPIRPFYEYCSEGEVYRPNARRKLFVHDWKSEDLTTLSLLLYEPTIQAMTQRGLPPQNVAASLYQYAKKWAFSTTSITEENVSLYKRSCQRDVVEAVERLLPQERRLLPCTFILEMLRLAITLECSSSCRDGLETRIGKQLEQATVKDLLLPSQCHAKELQYDIECVKRILKHFYSNYSSPDTSALLSVAQLIEEFCIEVASDIDLKADTFVALADMSVAASLHLNRNSDGIYRAVDVYLDKHRYLTDMEKEEICRVLDCQKMSPEACEHAAKNGKLPLRFLVQVLFLIQLQLRDTVSMQVQVVDERFTREEVDEEEEKEASSDDEEIRTEMERMSIKVMELERECQFIKKGIENGCIPQKPKKGKDNVWRMMKRKLGCSGNIHDYNSQVKKKKVHPKC